MPIMLPKPSQTSIDDLRRRIDNILLGITEDDKPFTVKDMGVGGSIVALLLDALKPNLVQTTEGTPAFVHCGPFANIAHGCNSVMATAAALEYGDYVAAALHEGSLGAYCADVMAQEPPSKENPLFGEPNAYLTPHIAWATYEARERLNKQVAANVKAFLEGNPINVVNK